MTRTTPARTRSAAVVAAFFLCLAQGRAGLSAPDAPRPEVTDAPAGADPSGERLLVRHCSIEFDRATLLPAAGTGILRECLVRPGDLVKEGEVLGRLNDEDARAELELKAARANSDVELRLSRSKRAYSQSVLKSSESLLKRNLVSVDQHGAQRLELEAASLAVEEAEFQHKIAGVLLRQAEAAVRLHEITSPHKGTVVAVMKHKGEFVGPERGPVFHIVDTSHVKVTGAIDIAEVRHVSAGDRVRITPEIGGDDIEIEHQSFQGRVVFVDRFMDPETQTCKVVAEVENRDELLKGGLRASMEIFFEGAGTQGEPGLQKAEPSAASGPDSTR